MISDEEVERVVLALVTEAVPRIRRVRVSITSESHLRRDLGLDSLGVVAMLFGFEKRLGVDVTKAGDLDLAQLQTVGDAMTVGKYIVRQCEAQKP
jgi:acyl carrier protein